MDSVFCEVLLKAMLANVGRLVDIVVKPSSTCSRDGAN